MCRLLESISLKDGVLENLAYHERRIEHSRAHFGYSGTLNLEPVRATAYLYPIGWHKIRFEYTQQIEQITSTPYEARPIRSLKIVHADQLDYSFKYADRSEIDSLFAMRGKADDILICRNGLVTDTSYCNVAFLDNGQWITPRNPLLPGTKRAQLLEQGKVREEDINLEQLATFTQIAFINAFLDPIAVELLLVDSNVS